MGEELPEKLLNSLEESRRSFVSKLILGTSFVVPGVASFSMSGLGLNEALAQSGNQSHTSGPAAGNRSQAATKGGTNVSLSGNNTGNTTVSHSGNDDRSTISSNNTRTTTVSPSTTGDGSATATLDGTAVVNDTSLNQTTTKIATSVVDGSATNSASSVYVPIGRDSGMSNSLSGVNGTGIIQVQQNTTTGALQQQGVALGSVVGSGSGIGNSR